MTKMMPKGGRRRRSRSRSRSRSRKAGGIMRRLVRLSLRKLSSLARTVQVSTGSLGSGTARAMKRVLAKRIARVMKRRGVPLGGKRRRRSRSRSRSSRRRH